ncbi:MAG: hypothetical protein ACRCW0_08070 [Clostridium sp.]
MKEVVKLLINNFDKWFVPITTSITLIISIKTFYMNKFKDQPRVKIIFESIDASKARTGFNIIIKNESAKPIYNFKINNNNELNEITKYKEIGFVNNPIPIFESGQVFKSYFANFKELREKGIEKIGIEFEYSIKKKGKKFKEKYEYNLCSFSKISSIVING